MMNTTFKAAMMAKTMFDYMSDTNFTDYTDDDECLQKKPDFRGKHVHELATCAGSTRDCDAKGEKGADMNECCPKSCAKWEPKWVPPATPDGHVVLQLAADTTLANDIYIEKDSLVFIDGAGKTMKMGRFQIQIEAGARLCMYNLNLIDGQV